MDRKLRVLQVNRSDLIGRRFNNFDAVDELEASEVESRMVVWERKSDRANIRTFLGSSRLLRRANAFLTRTEASRDIHARYQKQSFLLALHPWFRWADVVHYHIVHDQWFSLDAMPFLSRLKPTLWTFHDPWMMTGHCLYPMDCERWRIGCGHCPHLDRPFSMRTDRSGEQHAYKVDLLRRTNAEVVLASRHMMNMAQASPILSGKTLHHLPFGIDLNKFSPGREAEARARLGVRPDRLVIAFRGAIENPFKGIDRLMAAIDLLPSDLPPLCLLTTHGHMAWRWLDRHQVIELGWVDSEAVLIDSNLAADIVVIPSLAEAFGMMAIEAMACGKPVLVGARTSLGEIAGAPEVGVEVDALDPPALAAAIVRLARDPAERIRRGAAGRLLAEQRYDIKTYAGRLAGLYRSAVGRRQP